MESADANAHGQWRSRARTLNALRELELHTTLLQFASGGACAHFELADKSTF
jgi:hypothetical protein